MCLLLYACALPLYNPLLLTTIVENREIRLRKQLFLPIAVGVERHSATITAIYLFDFTTRTHTHSYLHVAFGFIHYLLRLIYNWISVEY